MIKAGDLVMVVKPTECCKSSNRIGSVFTVRKIHQGEAWCGLCGKEWETLTCAIYENGDADIVSRLIRIDPPAQPEDVETPEELTA